MKYLLKKLIHYADKAIACLVLLAVILTMIPVGIYASESNSETPPENSIAEEESDFSPEQEESTSISPSASDDEELISEESTDGEETEIESDNEESSSDNLEEPSSEEIPTIEEAPSEELSPSESEAPSTPSDESENEAQDDEELEEPSEPETSSEGSLDTPADPSESVEESVEESETDTEAESTAEEMPPESTEPVESTEEPSEEDSVAEEDSEPYTGYVDIGWGNAYAEAITVKVIEDGEPATRASNSGARLVKYPDTETKIKPASTMELRYDNDYLRNVVPGWENNTAYALFGPGDGGFPVKYIYDYNGYSYSNGEVCFCIVPESPTFGRTDYDGETEDSAVDWRKFSENQQEAIKLILAFGFPTEDYSVANDPGAAALANISPGGFVVKLYEGESDSAKNIRGWKMAEQYIATQLLIWEIIMGYRDVHTYEFRKGQELVDFYSTDYATLHNCYDSIVALLKAHNQVPSFMSMDPSSAPTYTLVPTGASTGYAYRVYDSDGSDGLYDANAVLEDYYTLYDSNGAETQFPISGINLKLAKGNNRLYIAADEAAAEYIRSKGSLSFSFDGIVGSPSGSCVIYSDPKGQSQTLVKANLYPDPIAGHFNLRVEDNDLTVSCLKVDELGNSVVGATLRLIRNSTGETICEWITDGSAKEISSIDYPNLIAGESYTLREIKTPTGYLPAEDVSITLSKTSAPQEIKMVDPRFCFRVAKVNDDGEYISGAKLQMWTLVGSEPNLLIHEWVSGTAPYTIPWDAYKDILSVGDYFTIIEVSPAPGYASISVTRAFNVKNQALRTIKIVDPDICLEIAKASVDNPEVYIGGADLELWYEDELLARWTSVAGQTYKVDPLNTLSGHIMQVGLTYRIVEASPPQGMTTADPVSFILRDTDDVQLIVMKDESVDLSILKVDENDIPLADATLVLLDADGNIVEPEWISTTEPHQISSGSLTVGQTYILREISAPEGYIVAEDKAFTLTDTSDPIEVVFENVRAKVYIQKVNISYTPLSGAILQVLDGSTVIDEWTSNGIPHELDVSRLVVGKKYTLKEISAPEGYRIMPPTTFVYEGDQIQTIYAVNLAEVGNYIQKVDQHGDPVVGVTLALYKGSYRSIPADDANLVATWTTTETPYQFVNSIGKPAILPVGNYTVFETYTPEGYKGIMYFQFTVQESSNYLMVTFENYKYEASVRVKKTDSSGTLLPDAVLVLEKRVATETGGSGGVTTSAIPAATYNFIEVARWNTAEENPKEIGNLGVGTYRIREISAPEGFVLAPNKAFEITAENDGETLEYTIVNNQTVVRITKVDVDGNPVVGATLELHTSTGDLVGEPWVTNGSYKEFVGLSAGQTYVIVETEAPGGYAVANSKSFVVSSSLSVQSISYVNNKYPDLSILKVDEDGNVIAGADLVLQRKVSDGWETVDSWTTTNESLSAAVKYVEVTSASDLGTGAYVFIAEADGVYYALTRADTGSYVAATRLNIGELSSEIDASLIEESVVWTTTGSGTSLILGDGCGSYLSVSISGKTYTLNYGENEGTMFSFTRSLGLFRMSASRRYVYFDTDHFDISTTNANIFRVYKRTTMENSDARNISSLPLGTYRLVEKSAPDGYIVSDPYEFTLHESDYDKTIPIKFVNYPTETEFLKVDEFGTPLAGATLAVIAKNAVTGEEIVVDQWISEEVPHILTGLLTDAQAEEASIVYILREIQAPPGCVLAEDIEFSVGDGSGTAKIQMENTHLPTLLIEKINEDGDFVSGASLTLEKLDNEEWNALMSWQSTDSAYNCGYLEDGTYRLRETDAPDGYCISPSVEIRIEKGNVKIGYAAWEKIGENKTILVKFVNYKEVIPPPTGLFVAGMPAAIILTGTGFTGLASFAAISYRKRKRKY